jgi:hypothetical protein
MEASRRSLFTYASLAVLGSTLAGPAAAQAAPSPKPGGGPGSAIHTRKASCNCGQLTAICTGPDPERRSLCHCKNCQMRTGSAYSIQTRYPRSQVKIAGKSKTWTFPQAGSEPVAYRSCDSGGVTYHFCPECGSNVFYDLAVAPDFIGIKVGAFADPTFTAPVISGFEEYRFPWALNPSALPMEHVA